jgi:hypothetical protein
MRRTTSRLGLALLALIHVTCESVPMLAPPGSTISLLGNPCFIPSHGGVSRIIAIVTEEVGTPVADGTLVMFFTDLGRIDERGYTNDGVAQVNLIADSRSGVATVTAVSGGGAVAPVASPSPSASRGVSAAKVAAECNSSAESSTSIDIAVGNVNVEAIHLRAEPGRIGSSRSTVVIATVLDASGNPVANVPVYFRVTSTGGTEFFDNAGPVFTDNNGEADSVLQTRRATSGTVTVEAEAAGGTTGLVSSETLPIPIF